MKLWKFIKLLRRNSIQLLKFSFWLVNQLLLFQKSNIDIIDMQMLNLSLMLKLFFPQMVVKVILKTKILMINQLHFKKVCSYQAKKSISWTKPS